MTFPLIWVPCRTTSAKNNANDQLALEQGMTVQGSNRPARTGKLNYTDRVNFG